MSSDKKPALYSAALLLGVALVAGAPAFSQEAPATSLPGAPATLTPEQQQAQILADTRRLYQLAAELKLELVNSPPDTLSLAMVKKAAEIERLARSLNQRMKN